MKDLRERAEKLLQQFMTRHASDQEIDFVVGKIQEIRNEALEESQDHACGVARKLCAEFKIPATLRDAFCARIRNDTYALAASAKEE